VGLRDNNASPYNHTENDVTNYQPTQYWNISN